MPGDLKGEMLGSQTVSRLVDGTRSGMKARRWKIAPVFFGQRLGAAAAVADHMQGFPGGQQFAGGMVENLITETQRAALRFRHAGANEQNIVEASRLLIAAAGLGDDDEAI